ncbi:MAG: hypothetical protein J6Y31_03345 [Bacteroidales bacterium]|nr:hypothetical protein [Bacteroidales bacterium]MBP5373934.1 hypothetical protein [Bacteroidales bacterium]
MKKQVLVFLLFAASLVGVSAQEYTVFNYTRIDRDPALSATAGAALASPRGASWRALHGAAVLVRGEAGREVAASYQNWGPSSGSPETHIALAGAANFGQFAISAAYAHQIHATYQHPTQGSVTPQDQLVSLGAALAIGDWFSIGLNGRFSQYMTVPGTTYGALSGDVSLYFTPVSGLGIIAGVSTFGSDMIYNQEVRYHQPVHLFAGVSYDWAISEDHLLAVHAAGEYYFAGHHGLAAGLEYSFRKMFWLRGGYRFASQECIIPAHASAGLGVNLWGLRLELSYLFGSEQLSNTLTLGLAYSF